MNRARHKARQWKTSEVALCQQMWNAGEDAGTIAKALNRTPSAIYTMAERNRETYGFARKNDKKMLAGHKKAIAREFELAVTRALAATGRKRGAVITEFVHYAYLEKRRKVAQKITDLGGMNVNTGALRKRESAAA